MSHRLFPFTQGRATVKGFIGGAFQAIPRFGDQTNADVVWVIDTESELQVVEEFRSSAFITTSLGSGETSHTLAERLPPKVRKHVLNVANTLAINGLAQAPGLGAAAMLQMIESDEYERQVELLADTLLIKHNGKVDTVVLDFYAGTAGGTGSPGEILLASDLAQRLREKLHASIESNCCLVGGITAIGLGDRTKKNSAAGITNTLAFVTDPACPSTEIRSVTLTEFAPVGNDRLRRETFAREFNQAMKADEVERLFQIKSPNLALDSRFGNIRLIEADFFRSLDPVVEIAPQIASDWSLVFQQILSGNPAQPSQIAEINVDLARTWLERESIEEIVDRVADSEQQEIVAAILLPACTATTTVNAVLRKGQRIALNHVAATFAAAPSSLADTRYRLQLIRSLSAAFEEEVIHFEAKAADQERVVGTWIQKFLDAFDAMRTPSAWQRLTSSPNSRLMELEKSAEGLRRSNDEFLDLRVQLDALRFVAAALKVELDFLTGHLVRVIEILAGFLTPMQKLNAQRLVTSVSIDKLFGRVWGLPSKSESQQLAVITSGVDKVTIAGLASCTAADPGRLDRIAEQILRGEPTFTGPRVGGITNPQRATRLSVLPPVDTDVAVQLTKLIKSLEPDNVVAFTSSASAGVNVLRFRVFGATCLDDVYSGLMRQSLKAASNDEHRALHFPLSKDPLRPLGIRIEDEVIFETNTNGAVHHG